jgi:uncharacterized protein (TIGR03086 family)
MSSVPGADRPPGTVELLDRAVAYARGSLAMVRPADLGKPTPCAAWCLGDLLRHLDDSLAALAEAACTPRLALAPVAGPSTGAELLISIKARACALVGQWSSCGEGLVALGELSLAREMLGAVGALEITVHGWDVAQACGGGRPIPLGLADDLWAVAHDHITAADRPSRFAAAVPISPSASPSLHLLAHAGRNA